jgi:hypothetical protein
MIDDETTAWKLTIATSEVLGRLKWEYIQHCDWEMLKHIELARKKASMHDTNVSVTDHRI